MPDGTPSYSALLFEHGLTTIFLAGGLGVEDKQNGLREGRIYSM
jgi:hypothetical protein